MIQAFELHELNMKPNFYSNPRGKNAKQDVKKISNILNANLRNNRHLKNYVPFLYRSFDTQIKMQTIIQNILLH